MIIRPAQIGDAPEIANVHIHAWQESYIGLIDQSYLDRLPGSFRKRLVMWHDVLANQQDKIFLVAESNIGIIGFASFGPARDAHFETYGEMTSLYLLQQFKKQGTGFGLLKGGMNQLFQHGFEKAYCWALKDNPTINFYKQTGAVFNGDTKEDERDGYPIFEEAYVWPDLTKFKE